MKTTKLKNYRNWLTKQLGKFCKKILEQNLCKISWRFLKIEILEDSEIIRQILWNL